MKFGFNAEGDNRKMRFGLSLEKEEGELGFFEALDNKMQAKFLESAEDDSDIIDIVEDEV